uniref:Uncharacterized protein n=1 Tax=Romanomermis culicivorax TaxID=13658 RepID=A0A915JL80_ROMCU
MEQQYEMQLSGNSLKALMRKNCKTVFIRKIWLGSSYSKQLGGNTGRSGLRSGIRRIGYLWMEND